MRRGLQAALLLVLSTTASLLAAEGALRLLRPDLAAAPGAVGNTFWHHDPELGWAHRPGEIGTFSRLEFSHPVSINSMGFRDRERSLPAGPSGDDGPAAGPGPARIAVFGDSFAWGHGVSDEQIFTRLLERMLPGVEVWNLGVSAYATDQELLLFRRLGRAIRADLVLVMLSRNDFEGNVSRRAGAYPKPWFEEHGGDLRLAGVPVPPPSLWVRGQWALRRRSALANTTWHLLGGEDEEVPRASAGRDDEIRMMRLLLTAFDREAGEAGARFVVAFVPSTAHVYRGNVPELEERRLEAVRAWGVDSGVTVLDLVPAFRAAFASTGRWYHYRRDKHWNAQGHRLAAEALSTALGRPGPPPRP